MEGRQRNQQVGGINVISPKNGTVLKKVADEPDDEQPTELYLLKNGTVLKDDIAGPDVFLPVISPENGDSVEGGHISTVL